MHNPTSSLSVKRPTPTVDQHILGSGLEPAFKKFKSEQEHPICMLAPELVFSIGRHLGFASFNLLAVNRKFSDLGETSHFFKSLHQTWKALKHVVSLLLEGTDISLISSNLARDMLLAIAQAFPHSPSQNGLEVCQTHQKVLLILFKHGNFDQDPHFHSFIKNCLSINKSFPFALLTTLKNNIQNGSDCWLPMTILAVLHPFVPNEVSQLIEKWKMEIDNIQEQEEYLLPYIFSLASIHPNYAYDYAKTIDDSFTRAECMLEAARAFAAFDKEHARGIVERTKNDLKLHPQLLFDAEQSMLPGIAEWNLEFAFEIACDCGTPFEWASAASILINMHPRMGLNLLAKAWQAEGTLNPNYSFADREIYSLLAEQAIENLLQHIAQNLDAKAENIAEVFQLLMHISSQIYIFDQQPQKLIPLFSEGYTQIMAHLLLLSARIGKADANVLINYTKDLVARQESWLDLNSLLGKMATGLAFMHGDPSIYKTLFDKCHPETLETLAFDYCDEIAAIDFAHGFAMLEFIQKPIDKSKKLMTLILQHQKDAIGHFAWRPEAILNAVEIQGAAELGAANRAIIAHLLNNTCKHDQPEFEAHIETNAYALNLLESIENELPPMFVELLSKTIDRQKNTPLAMKTSLMLLKNGLSLMKQNLVTEIQTRKPN